MHIKDIIEFIENKFPLDLQESYDNCGLTYGHLHNKLKGVLVCLDVTDKIVEEATSPWVPPLRPRFPLLPRLRPFLLHLHRGIAQMKTGLAVGCIHLLRKRGSMIQ